MVGARVVLIALGLLASTSWALGGVSDDRKVVERLVVTKSDAGPMFPGYEIAWDISPCRIATVASDDVTAAASGGWGGVDHGLWSKATVVATHAAADRLYDRAVASSPTCLLRWAKKEGLAAYSGYKTRLCKRASLQPLAAKRYGDRSRAFRAEYSRRWRFGCTVRALDGFVVQTRRAVALYIFDNANAKGRFSTNVTTQDEALVRRVVTRGARSS